MRGIALAALCSCLFALGMSAGPAQAGDYGYGASGYGAYGPGQVWYSSSCCYRRVVRHQRDVFYQRAGTYIPDAVLVYPRPRVYAYMVPHRRVRFSEFDYYSRYGDYGRVGCYWKEVPVPDLRGGWVWGRKTTCY
jgi:hypothetical protein